MKYSLAKYTLTITSKDARLTSIFGESLTIGGQGSTNESITIQQDNPPISIQTYTTGGYVFSDSYDRSGSASISINQLSDAAAKLRDMIKTYYTTSFDPFTIVVYNNDGQPVAEAEDCYPNTPPALNLGSSAANQNWSFICGKVTIN